RSRASVPAETRLLQRVKAATRPPRDLGASGRALWRDVQVQYSITDAAGLALLAVACRALDRMAEAHAETAAEGLMIVATGRANPAIKIEVDARNHASSAMPQPAN